MRITEIQEAERYGANCFNPLDEFLESSGILYKLDILFVGMMCFLIAG